MPVIQGFSLFIVMEDKDLCLGYEYMYDLYNNDVHGLCHECLVKKFNDNLALTFARRPNGFTKFEFSELNENGKIVRGKRIDQDFFFNITNQNALQEVLTMIQESSRYKDLLQEFQIDNETVLI